MINSEVREGREEEAKMLAESFDYEILEITNMDFLYDDSDLFWDYALSFK